MKDRQEGFAMILVMCVMIIATALCLSLLLAASVSFQNASRINDKEQCRINAVSVSNVLIDEITSFEYGDSLSDEEVDKDGNLINPDRSLRDKLQTVYTDRWNRYAMNGGGVEPWPTQGTVMFTYDLSSDQLPGDTVAEFYWIDENEGSKKELDEATPEDSAEQFENIILYLKVTSTVGKESSTVLSCFRPNVNCSGDVVEGSNQCQWSDWRWEFTGHEWERGRT